MKAISYKALFIFAVLLFNTVIPANAESTLPIGCKIAKSYIITLNGNGYSVAGKLNTSSQIPVGDYIAIPSNFVGAMAFTRGESYVRPSSVVGTSSINFAANCDMNVEINLDGLPLTFTAYSDDSINANGVLIGGVQLQNDKSIGITGGIRIATH